MPHGRSTTKLTLGHSTNKINTWSLNRINTWSLDNLHSHRNTDVINKTLNHQCILKVTLPPSYEQLEEQSYTEYRDSVSGFPMGVLTGNGQ